MRKIQWMMAFLALGAFACGAKVDVDSATATSGSSGSSSSGGGGADGGPTCGPSAPCGQGDFCEGQLNLTTCGEDYACSPIPSACAATPTCDCLTMAAGLISCSGDATSGLTGEAGGGDSPNCP